MRTFRKTKEQKGQAALETLLVLALFFLVSGFFILSVFFLLGRVNAQGAMATAGKEVASLGCVPTLVDDSGTEYDYNDEFLLERFSAWGAEIQSVTWDYRSLSDLGYTSLPSCDAVFRPLNPADPAPSGSLVRGTVVYNQNLPIFSADSTISFETASSSIGGN